MKPIGKLAGFLICMCCIGGCAADPGKCTPQGKTCVAKKRGVPRRAVPQAPVRVAPIQTAPSRPPAPPPQRQPEATRPPATVTTCDPGGCWNTDGSRYEGGAGGTYLDRNGRLCQRNGVMMQCF